MREVESESKKRPLIATDYANKRHAKVREVIRKRKMNHIHIHSQRTFQTLFILFILFILAIVLPIATIFAAVFELKSCDFGGFNVLNNELEKSGLSDNQHGRPNGPKDQAELSRHVNKLVQSRRRTIHELERRGVLQKDYFTKYDSNTETNSPHDNNNNNNNNNVITTKRGKFLKNRTQHVKQQSNHNNNSNSKTNQNNNNYCQQHNTNNRNKNSNSNVSGNRLFSTGKK